MPRLLIVVLCVSIVIRVASLSWVVLSGSAETLVYGDASGYLELAQSLWNDYRFVALTDGELKPEVFRTPGLPLLLAPFSGTSTALIVYLFLQAIIAGVLLPLLVWNIGKRLFNETSAIIAATLAAIEPNLIFFSWLPLTEIAFIMFSLGGIYAFLRAQEEKRYWFAILAGAFAGFAILIKPGMVPIIVVGLCILLAASAWDRSVPNMANVVVVIIALVFMLAPWSVRNHALTGSYALSGAGWRNIYTDYLASIRALENGTGFSEEKNALKEEAEERFGLSRYELSSPEYSAVIKEYALQEVWAHKGTAVRLETALLFSFFTNDSYYSYLARFGFIDYVQNRTSPTYTLLTKGLTGVQDILMEMRRQFFIPILGRAFMLGVLALALIGFFAEYRNRAAWFIAMIIGLAALASTAIGLGVEARLRLPIQPLLFLLAGAGLYRVVLWYPYVRSRFFARHSSA